MGPADLGTSGSRALRGSRSCTGLWPTAGLGVPGPLLLRAQQPLLSWKAPPYHPGSLSELQGPTQPLFKATAWPWNHGSAAQGAPEASYALLFCSHLLPSMRQRTPLVNH